MNGHNDGAILVCWCGFQVKQDKCSRGCMSYPEIIAAAPTIMDVELANQQCIANCLRDPEHSDMEISAACKLGCKHSCFSQLAQAQLYNIDFKIMVVHETGW